MRRRHCYAAVWTATGALFLLITGMHAAMRLQSIDTFQNSDLTRPSEVDTVLTSGPVTPTNEWINCWSDSTRFDGAPVPVGSIIRAFDPQNTLCGIDTVRNAGEFGLMAVYRDDSTTPLTDEGCVPGDIVHFTINGKPAISFPGTPIWTENGAIVKVHLVSLSAAISIDAGWNMISLPLAVSDPSVSVLFPTALGPAFAFMNGYAEVGALAAGEGYWLKFSSGFIKTIAGASVMPKDVQVDAGWNMIGAYEYEVNVASITCTPPGSMLSNFYEYRNGYVDASSLVPGKGYWIKVSTAAVLHLPAGTMKMAGPQAPAHSATEADYGILEFEDNAASSAVLYVADTQPIIDGSGSISRAELPPLPPTESFDVRYCTNSRVWVIDTAALHQTILLQGVHFPLTIKASGDFHGRNFRVEDETHGDRLLIPSLKGGSTFTLTQPTERIRIESAGAPAPAEFSVSQNYPNPFNPSTRIDYAIPVSARVSLEVFDVLGRIISRVVDQEQPAGFYSVTFDARPCASGIYFFRFKANAFSMTRSMQVIK